MRLLKLICVEFYSISAHPCVSVSTISGNVASGRFYVRRIDGIVYYTEVGPIDKTKMTGAASLHRKPSVFNLGLKLRHSLLGL